jgi:transposase-like protein
MHERIEAFLKDVLRYQGKNSDVVRDGVHHLLTAYEKQIRDAENDPRTAFPAAQRFRKLCRDRVIEEIQQRTAISSISHFQTVLSVIDTLASE